MMRRTALAVAALLVAVGSADAAGTFVARKEQSASGTILRSYYDESGVGVGPFDPVMSLPNGATLGGATSAGPATGTGAYANPATVNTSSTQVLAATSSGRAFLDLKNESTSQPIACSFGGTAALNTAGSFTIAAGGDARWEGSFVPSDQVNCITSTGTAPLTIGVH